jgi:hypothetical protein
MAQFWIAIFFIFLAVAQLYQSIKDINLPLPVYLVLGVMLAVASNSQQQLSFTPARQTTSPQLEESEPILNLIPALPSKLEESQPILSLIPAPSLADDIELSDSNTLETLSAVPLVEVIEEIQPVEIEQQFQIQNLIESIPTVSPHPQPFSLMEKGAGSKVPLPEGEGFRVRANQCDTPAVDIDAPPVSLAATEPSPPEIPAADELNPVDSDEPPVVLVEPQAEVSSKKQAKPVAKKTTRKKSTSSKTRK